ncbi:MAG TPA: ATP-binding cassette domain-containing protein [Salinimicrobium sp.]|nr:ATP-binding cassette domain-containing protein [Salinimicrobium sp.]
MKHTAVYGNTFPEKEKWLQKLLQGGLIPEIKELSGKKGAFFSQVILDKFIEEDYRHGQSKLVRNNRSLRTFSSGEKKKALFEYLLQQNPDFLILDDPFDSLDFQSVTDLKIKITEISRKIPIVQIFKRKEDLFPFIDEVLQVENEKITNIWSRTRFLEHTSSEEIFSETKNIPAPPAIFENIPDVLVKLDQVSVKYDGRSILNKISWEIKKGEFWKLSGPNGSGKTTLLSMIYGDNPKAYGVDLYLFGNKKGSGESVWDIKKKIGYFSPNLTELFSRRNTVLEMLVSGLVDSIGLYQKPNEAELRLAKEWLETIGLEDMQKKIFTHLPILQQRMLLIARAMIKHPPLLILDEPTTSLGDESALKITNLINLIAWESETAVIYVSHRKEKGLKPNFEYELIPTSKGSIGRAVEKKEISKTGQCG